MKTVTVSPKYQVVIPREIREAAGIRPGQKLQFFYMDGHIKLVPEVDVKSLRGSLQGLDISNIREDEEYH